MQPWEMDWGVRPNNAATGAEQPASPSSKPWEMQWDKPEPAKAEEPRSILKEVPVQAYAGLTIDLPKQFGQALQWMSNEGSDLHSAGKDIQSWAEQRAKDNPDLAPQNDGRGSVGTALSTGARALAPSLAVMAPAAIGAVAAPVVGAGAALGAAGGAAAGAFGLFGASQAQDTYQKLKDSGVPDSEAKKAGWINLMIEGGGETIGDVAGLKLFGMLGKAVGGANPIASAIKSATDGAILKPFLSQLGKTAGTETATEFAQNFGESYVEKTFGAKNAENPWTAGVEGAQSALGMTILLAPFGLGGFAARAKGNQRVAAALEDPNAPTPARMAAARVIYGDLSQLDPDAAKAWSQNSSFAIATGAPIDLDESTAKEGKYFGGPGQPATEADAHADAAGARMAAEDAANAPVTPTHVDWTEWVTQQEKQHAAEKLASAPTVDDAIAAANDLATAGPSVADRVAEDQDRLLAAMEKHVQMDTMQKVGRAAMVDQDIARAEGEALGLPDETPKTAMQMAFEAAKTRAQPIPAAVDEAAAVPAAPVPAMAPAAPTTPQWILGATTEHLNDARNLTRSANNRQLIDEELARRQTAPVVAGPVSAPETLPAPVGGAAITSPEVPGTQAGSEGQSLTPPPVTDVSREAILSSDNIGKLPGDVSGQSNEAGPIVGRGGDVAAARQRDLSDGLNSGADGLQSGTQPAGIPAAATMHAPSIEGAKPEVQAEQPAKIAGRDVKTMELKGLRNWAKSKNERIAATANTEIARREEETAVRRQRVAALKEQANTPSRKFLRTVSELGGVKSGESLDVTSEKNAVKLGGMAARVFRKDGNGLDYVATQLHERGLITDAEYNDVDGGVQRVRDMLRAAVNGTLEAHTEEDMQTEYDRLAEDAQAEFLAEQEALDKPGAWDTMSAEQKDEELDSLFGPDSADQSTQATASGAETRAQETAGEVGQAEQRPALDLTGQSEAEIQRERTAAERDKEQQRNRDAAPSPDSFTLTGSDRAADVGSAHGQDDLLDFSRDPISARRSYRMSVAMAEKALDKAIKNLDVDVTIHPDIAAARAATIQNVPESTMGFVFRGGIHIIASHLHSNVEAQAVLWHEVQHAGIMRQYGRLSTEYEQALTGIAGKNPLVRKAAAMWRTQYGEDARERAKAVGATDAEANRYIALQSYDEALAEMAERNVEIKGLSAYIEAVQRFLRSIGFDALADWMESHTNAEALRMIVDARAAVTAKPSNRSDDGDTMPAFTRDQTNTEAFQRWFGDSKVVDADGNPLVVYHGTKADITKFKKRTGDIGMHFGTEGQANDRMDYLRDHKNVGSADGENLLPVYLNIKNPLRLKDAGSWNADNLDYALIAKFPQDEARIKRLKSTKDVREYIQSKGYDGVVYRNTGEVKGARVTQAAQDAALKKMVESQRARNKQVNAYDLEDQKTPEYKAYTVASEAATSYREANAEDSYIAFAPTQIKSAVGNRGTFDPNNNDIAFSRGGIALGALTPAQEAALTNVHGTPVTWQQRLNAFKTNWKETLVQGIFDQYAPINKLNPAAYRLARQSKGGDATLEALLLYGKVYVDKDGAYRVDYQKSQGMNGFTKVISDLKGEQDRFLEWVAAQRAERLKGIGLENLYSNTDIQALKTLNAGTMKDGTLRSTAYAKALKALNEWNDSVLQIAVDSGLIDDATRKMYENTPYVPFYRLDDELDKTAGFSVKPGLVNQQAWKKLKGGTQHLNDDLLANLLQNWSHLITASAKNRAAKATLQAAVTAGVATQVPNSTPGKGLVSYKDAGKDNTFRVSDDALMDAVAALHYAGLGSIGKPFVAMKRWLTIGVTSNPAFKVRNLIRDSIQAIGTAELSYNPAKNVQQGFKATELTSETRAQMLAAGGIIRFGSMLDGNSASRTRRLIEEHVNPALLLNTPTKLESFWKTKLLPAFDAYQELGDRGEQISRAALYEQMLAKGMTHEEASFWARDLMDFGLSGKWEAVRILTQVVPFMNARLQGIYKLGRATKQDYKRMGAVLGTVALASIALMLAYGDDDDWKKREDWDRDNYWWFKVGGLAFRLPKPFEIGAVGTLAERSVEYFVSKEMTGKRLGERISATVFNQLSMNPTPQLVKPLMDIYANKDSFSGRPIESAGMLNLRKEDRYNERTSEIAKMLGSLGLPDPTQLAMGQWNTLSPVQIDSMVRGYFSWLGTSVSTALDWGIRPMMDRGQRPDMKLKDVFLAGNFLESLPTGSSRYVTQLYDQGKEIEEAYGSYRDALRRGDTAKAAEIRVDEKDKLAKHSMVESVKRKEGTLNAAIRMIEASKTMSGEEKRQRIDKYEQQKNRLAQSVVGRL